MNTSSHRAPNYKRSIFTAALLGVAFMAAIDEILFHQILAWHHFYDRSTPLVGLISDGFLHAGELIAFVAGFYFFSELRKHNELSTPHAWAGFFLGLGGFQLFDGIVDHKILRLHQIRYGVESILPYDLAWNGAALFLLVIGGVLLMHARRTESV